MNAFVAESGLLTYWNLSQESDPDILAAGFRNIGVGVTIPDGRTWLMAMKAAMQDICKHLGMIRPLDKKSRNGYLVVAEQKGRDDNDYNSIVHCKVSDNGHVTVVRGNIDEFAMNERTRYFKRVLPASDVGLILSSLAKKELGGLGLRDGGPPYFIPNENTVLWQKIGLVVQSAHKDNSVSYLPFVLNEHTIRDCRRELDAEYQAETDRILAELAENDLGVRAIGNRVENARKQIERLKEYEAFLGETLGGCREQLKTTLTALAHAQAAKDNQEIGGFMGV